MSSCVQLEIYVFWSKGDGRVFCSQQVFVQRFSVVTVGCRAQQYRAESVTAAEEISSSTSLCCFIRLMFSPGIGLVMYPEYSMIRNRGGEPGYWRYHKRLLTTELLQLHESTTAAPSTARWTSFCGLILSSTLGPEIKNGIQSLQRESNIKYIHVSDKDDLIALIRSNLLF